MLASAAAGLEPPFVDPRVLSQKGSLFLTQPALADYVATRAELEATACELFDVIAKGAGPVRVAQTSR